MATTPDIDAGKAGNPLDISDFANQLNQIPELTRSSIENTFRNFTELQQDVAAKQKSYQNDIRAQEIAALNAKNVRDKNAAIANIQLLERQKSEFDKVAVSLKEVTEEEKRIAKERKESLKDMGKGVLSGLGLGEIISFFSGGAAGMIEKVLSFIKDLLFTANQQTVEIGKNFQVGAEEAEKMRIAMEFEGEAAEGFAKVLKYRLQAQYELQESSKIILGLTKDQRDVQVELVQELGLSSQEGSRLNQLFTANNVEGTKGKNIIFDQVALFAKQTGYLFDTKKVLQDVSNVSGQIRATYKGSVEELTKAVMTAAKLGTTIEQTKSMSESLLNFETSIDNELKAELLTGQQLNLEKARSLALSGDYVGAGKEMLEQAGGLANFQRLNVIQQRSLAEAIGLSADQMADVLFKQTVQGKQATELADQYRALGAEDMARALESGKIQGDQLEIAKKRLTAEQEFALAMEQVKGALASLVSGNFLNRLVDLVKDLANYAAAFMHDIKRGDSVAGTMLFGPSNEAKDFAYNQEMSGLKQELQNEGLSEKERQKLTDRIAELEKERSERTKMDEVRTAAMVNVATGGIMGPFSTYAGVRGYNQATKIKDGAYIDGKMYSFERDDLTLMAGTSLFKGGKQEGESSTKRLESLMEKFIDIASKGQTIVMDNKVVGKTNVGYLLEYGANKIG